MVLVVVVVVILDLSKLIILMIKIMFQSKMHDRFD